MRLISIMKFQKNFVKTSSYCLFWKSTSFIDHFNMSYPKQIKTSHKYIMGVLCAILFCKCRYRTNTFSDIVSHLIGSVSWLCSKCTNRRSCQGLGSTVENEGYHGEHDGDYAGGIWSVISQYPCVPLEIFFKSGFPLQG